MLATTINSASSSRCLLLAIDGSGTRDKVSAVFSSFPGKCNISNVNCSIRSQN